MANCPANPLADALRRAAEADDTDPTIRRWLQRLLDGDAAERKAIPAIRAQRETTRRQTRRRVSA